MNFLVRFFTHWTKKKIIVCAASALVLAGASFGATRLFGKGGLTNIVKPSSIDSTMEAKPIGKTVEDFASDEYAKYNLFVAQKVLKDAGSFRTITEGQTKSTVFGVEAVQQIYAERVVIGDSVYKDSRSYGKYVKFADERFAHDGHYLYRNTGNLSSISKVNSWGEPKNFKREKDKSEEEAQNRYLARYGCIGNGMSAYILRAETIKSAKYLGRDEDGNYNFEYNLNVSNSADGACYCILKEMKTNAGTENFATFESAKLVVTMDANWVVKQIENDCKYSVPKVVKDGAETYEHMVETFDKVGEYKSAKELPKYEEFAKKFNSVSTGEEEAEKTAMSVIEDMFGDYLSGTPLNAKLTMNVGGQSVVGNVTAQINTADLMKTSVIAELGDKLFVSFTDGYITVSYDELKLKLSVDDVKNALNPADTQSEANANDENAEDGGSDVLSGILDNMKLTEYADGCTIEIPVEFGSLKIKVTVSGKKKVISTDKDGKEKYTYEFAGANAAIGDAATVDLRLSDLELKGPTADELANFADLKPVLEQFIGKNELSLKVDTNIELNGNALTAYIRVNLKDMTATVNVPDLFGADAVIKVDFANLKEKKGSAILSYGKLNAVLPFEKTEDLVKIVKNSFGDELAALTAKLPDLKNVDAAKILATISTAEIKKTETGYKFTINLGSTDNRKPITAEITADGGIKDLSVAFDKYNVKLSAAGDYEFKDVADGEQVDLADLAEKAIAAILPFVRNDGGYAVNFDGVKLTLGGNVYALKGEVKLDAKKNVAVNAEITLNGKPFAKADIKIADGTLYGEVNGYRFAAKVGGEVAALAGENAPFDFDKLKGYNKYLDEVVELIKKFASADFGSIEYGKIINSFAFDAESGKLTLTLNGEAFGLGEIALTATLGEENVSVTVANAKITENISAAIEHAEISTTDEEITVPAGEDYTTNVVVRYGKTVTVNARLDFINGIYDVKADLTIKGVDLTINAKIADGKALIKYNDLVVSANVDELLALAGDILASQGITFDEAAKSKMLLLLQGILNATTVGDSDNGIVVNLAGLVSIVIDGNKLSADLSAFGFETVTVESGEAEYETDYSDVRFTLSDIKPLISAVSDFISGNGALTVNARFADTDIIANVAVKVNGGEKYIILETDEIYGAKIVAKITKTVAYVNYGNVKLQLKFTDINGLVNDVKELISSITGKEIQESNLNVKDLIDEIVKSISKTDTDGGYAIKASYGDYALAIGFAGGSFADIMVSAANKTLATIAFIDDYTFGDVDDVNCVDVKELTNKALPCIKNIVNAVKNGGVAVNLGGVKLTLGGNVYALKGEVKLDAKKNVAVNAEITLNGKPFAKADIKIADGTLYGEVNGYRFAAKVGGGEVAVQASENAPFDFDKLKGYNKYLDEVVELIKKFASADFGSIEYGKIINSFAFDAESGKLTLTLNGEAFGLGEIALTATLGEENVSVTVANAKITENISITIENAEISTTGEEITVPDGDYTTNLKITVDESNVIYAKLDFLSGVYSFDLESRYGESNNRLCVEYDGINKIVYIKCGNAYVKCPIYEIKDITDKLKALAHPFVNSTGTQSEEEQIEIAESLVAFIKDLTDDLEIRSSENGSNIITSLSESLKGLLDISLDVEIGGDFGTVATVAIVQLNNKTLIVRGGNRSLYEDFSDKNCIDLAEVFGDYYPTLEKLADVSTNEKLEKSWTFTIHDIDINVKGTNYTVGETTFSLKYSKDLTVVDIPSLSVTAGGKTSTYALAFAYKKAYNADGTINEEDSRLYITFNDKTNEASSLKFSVSKAVLGKIVKEDLPGLLAVVPQIGELLTGNIGLSNIVNLATLVSNATYNREADKALSVTVNGDALISGLGYITLTISEPKTGAVKLDITAARVENEAQNIEINGISLAVAADEVISVPEYNTDGHTNLDSLQTLLRSFVKTANRTSYHLSGNVPIKLTAIGINVSMTVGVDIRVDIEKRKGQSDLVFVAAKISRGDLRWSIKNTVFDDCGGDSYLYFDGAAQTVTIKRNCYKKNTSKSKEVTFDKTVTAEEFGNNAVDYILELVNFIDSINDAITGSTPNAFGIDDVLTDYSYGDDAFTIKANLKPIDDVLGDATINIHHDPEGNLTALTGSVKLLDITAVSCTGTIDIKLVEPTEGDAKNCVLNKTLF